MLHASTNTTNVDDIDIRLIKFGPIALFSSFKLRESNGKHLEDISHAHIVSLIYKLITSAKDFKDLSVGFDRDCGRRQRGLFNNKIITTKYHLRIMLRDIIGFAENQEKATCGLAYKLTLTRKNDNSVLKKANETNNAKIRIIAIEWYIPHYQPSSSQQALLSKLTLSKVPT